MTTESPGVRSDHTQLERPAQTNDDGSRSQEQGRSRSQHQGRRQGTQRSQRNQVTVVHCWSAPRSRSTALLYSFEARGKDCVAIDEPLYRDWIIKKGDSIARPYKDALIRGEAPDGSDDDYRWKREVASLEERIQDAANTLECDGGVIFLKHMAKHCFLYDLESEPTIDLPENAKNLNLIHRHMLLIRDPVAVLSSWSLSSDVHNAVTPDEVGIIPMLSIYSSLSSRDAPPVVLLDSDELVADPEEALSGLCRDLEIPYTNAMLSWSSGEHACDGPWAKWWYRDVHKSDGWHRPTSDAKSYPSSYGTPKYRTLPPGLLPALKASLPAYNFLKSLTRGTQIRGPPLDEIYEDPRNANLLVWVGAPGRGRLIPRDMAGTPRNVHVFSTVFDHMLNHNMCLLYRCQPMGFGRTRWRRYLGGNPCLSWKNPVARTSLTSPVQIGQGSWL